MRLCILNSQTSYCENIIDADTADMVVADGFAIAPDTTGEVGWRWVGNGWRTPADIFIDVALSGTPTAPVADVSVSDAQVATALLVDLKIAQAITAVFASTDFVSDGFSDTGGNLVIDLIAQGFDDTGGNLASDISGGTF